MMVNAVNQLIEKLLQETYGETIDSGWFTKDRTILLEVLLKNLERIRSRSDLDILKIGDLVSYLYPLIRRYKKGITLRDFLQIVRIRRDEKIKEQIDGAILNIKNLLHYISVSEVIAQLQAQSVTKRLLDEAMTIPDLHDVGLNKIKNYILIEISNFGKEPLSKEAIFLLSFLRIAAYSHQDQFPIPQIERCRHFYEVKRGPSNYDENKEVAIIVKAAIIKLNQLYPSHRKIFLARDAFVLYEAQITLFKDNSDLIYVSRSTLGPLFNLLNTELSHAIEEVGINDVESIILNLEQRLRLLSQKTEIKDFFASLVRYVTPYVRPKTVFVDSSSRSLPVILAALCRIYFPNYDFKVFFAITVYNDPRIGYILNSPKNFIVDMLPEFMEFDPQRSKIIPYIQKLFPSDSRKMKPVQAYQSHLVLQSVLHS